MKCSGVNENSKVTSKRLWLYCGPLHRGAIGQFPVRWIYYCHSSESTGKEIGKTYLCALHCCKFSFLHTFEILMRVITEFQNYPPTVVWRPPELILTLIKQTIKDDPI